MKTNKRLLTGITLAATLAFGSATATVAQASSAQGENQEQVSVVFENGIKHGKLEAAILFNEHINYFDIQTDVHKDLATLSGTVKTDIEKDIAEQVALSVEGIKKVENNIVVDPKAAISKTERVNNKLMKNLSDAKITTVIESKLAVNRHLSALGIDVDTDNKKVTLSGTVESEQHKELAELIAENTSGVVDVENKLQVNPDVAMH